MVPPLVGKITIEPITSPSFNSGTFTQSPCSTELGKCRRWLWTRPTYVWNVNDGFRAHHTLQIMSRRGSYEWLSPPRLHESRRRSVGGNDAERLAFTQRHNTELGSAKLYCVRQHSFKHRLQFAG